MRKLLEKIHTGNLFALLWNLLIVYVAYSLCRLMFYLLNLPTYSDISGGHVLDLFGAGLIFDTSAIVYTNAILIIMFLLPLSIILISRSDFIATYYLQLETRFFANLNQKTMEERGERDAGLWLDEDYHVFTWKVPEASPCAGRTLTDLDWGKDNNIYVIKLEKGDRKIPMPAARTMLQTGDIVHLIGEERYCRAFMKVMGTTNRPKLQTLREYLESGYRDGETENALECLAIKVNGTEVYSGKQIKKSGISQHGRCMILGLERDGYATRMPDSNMMIEKGDILWIVGVDSNLRNVVAHSFGKAGTHKEENK